MTTRERVEELVGDWYGRFGPTDVRRAAVLIDAVEAALTAAYEEGASELIINAQVEYLRGQAEERERCAKVADSHCSDYDSVTGTVEALRHCVAQRIAAAIRAGRGKVND